MEAERTEERKKWAAPTLAAGILAMAIGAGALTPGAGAAAKGAISGSCNPAKSHPSIPCAATEGQTYGDYFIPDGAEDTEPSLEAVLGYIKREPTDVTAVAQGLQGGDSGEFEIQFLKSNPGAESFRWEYSGEAPLAFATVWSDEGGFAIYDVFKKTEGIVNFGSVLGESTNVNGVSFWQRTRSDCEPVKVVDTHGKGMIPGCQLSEVVEGKVLCIHVNKGKPAKCEFRTGARSSGKWLEGVRKGDDADFAMAGQAISREGKKGGPWIVASKTERDGGMPCKKSKPGKKPKSVAKRDSGSVAADGSLPGYGYTEVSLSSTNLSGEPLENYATLNVCGNTPPPHPDGATHVSHPSANVWCYTGAGAGMNDVNGMERYSPALGGKYIDDSEHRHFVNYNGGTVPAAKRPNTKPNGELISGSPIVWRIVNPNAKIAN